jgi:transposase
MWGFIDWGSQEHQLCLVDADGQVVCQRRFSHKADDLAKLCAVLRQPQPGLPAVKAVAIERNDGPVVDAMLEAGLAVYVINPRQIERFRVFVAPSGRKDDRLDAYVGAEALRLHPDRFVRLCTPEPWTIVLKDQLRLRNELVQQQVRLKHRIREQLQRYYPQFWELGSLQSSWQRAMWHHVSTPAKAQRVRPQTIARLLKKHHVRRYDAEEVLKVLRQTPLRVAEGVVDGALCRLRCHFAELELVFDYIDLCEREMKRLIEHCDAKQRAQLAPDEPTDIELLRQIPGFSYLQVAALYAYASEALTARNWQHLRARSGVAPVSTLTGNKQNQYHKRAKPQVRIRRACSKPLRNTLFHAAAAAAMYSAFYKTRYKEYRQKGHTHGRACRQIGDHLLRILVAMLKSRQPFDPSRFDNKHAEA